MKTISQTKNNYIPIFLSVGSGCLLTAAFPKADIPFLAWIGLIPLFFAIRSVSVKESFRLGFIAGLIHYMTLMYWIIHAMNVYGKISLVLCVPVLFLFASYLSIYFAFYTAIVTAYCQTPLKLAYLSPILWVALEYIRSSILTGFPWELLGHSQYRFLHFIQISDIVGVYGVSFILVGTNGAIFLSILGIFKKKWHQNSVTSHQWMLVLLTTGIVLTAIWGYGKKQLSFYENNPVQNRIQVAVVQGNIDQMIKWKPAFQKSTVEKYLSLTQQASKSELVVWPETATPFYFKYDIELTHMVLEGVKQKGAWLLTGSPSFEEQNGGFVFFNSAYLIDPNGTIQHRYDKAHLVPFGEYVPLKEWLPFIGKMVEHVGDFKPGPVGKVLDVGTIKMGTLICYEIIFPYLSRAMVKNGASFLVNITNDAWYGTTSGPYQHFSLAVFRAVENKRPIVRSANTGISGFINAVGRIEQTTPLFQETTVVGEIAPSDVITVYCQLGDLFAKLCIVFMFIYITVTKIIGGRTYAIRIKRNH